jgi:carboxyl-terminal processing protease
MKNTTRFQRNRHLLSLTAVVAAALLCAAPGGTPDDVAPLVKKAAAASPQEAGALAGQLAALGRDAVGAIRKAAEESSAPAAKLTCGIALCRLRDEFTGARLLSTVLGNAKADQGIRAAAAEAIGLHGNRLAAFEVREFLKIEKDAGLRIGAVKALLKLNRESKEVGILQEYAQGEDAAAARQAALALGALGMGDRARTELEKIATEPSADGEMARMALSLLTRESTIRSLRAAKGDVASQLLSEIIDKVQNNYWTEKKTAYTALIAAAAKGMVRDLDPHSSYLNDRDRKNFERAIGGEYGGIGALVGFDEQSIFTIISPIYSGPAYRAGIRSRDKILKIDGVETHGKEIDDLVDMLRGPANTPVSMEILRPTTGARKEIRITREVVKLPSVRYEMLPEKIGYIRLSSFGRMTESDLEKALHTLEGRGMAGLLLDLRDNGGGLLSTAVSVVSKFLPKGKVVVFSKGRARPANELRATGIRKHPDYPVVVLINGGSASASEIVAGALQVHGRAELVGIRSFGKGSIQELMPLKSTEGRTRLRLTVAKYYLADGRDINKDPGEKDKDEWGVTPDVKAEQPDRPLWIQQELSKIMEEKAFNAYVDKHYKDHKELFTRTSTPGSNR